MQALDFVLYCVGTSTFLVATAASARILAGIGTRPVQTPAKQAPVLEADDHLASRLRDFQAARYASPIIQRRLDPNVAPPPRVPMVGPRPTICPIPRVVPPPPPPVRPRATPARDDDNVIPIPLKMKKNDEPPKEGA